LGHGQQVFLLDALLAGEVRIEAHGVVGVEEDVCRRGAMLRKQGKLHALPALLPRGDEHDTGRGAHAGESIAADPAVPTGEVHQHPRAPARGRGIRRRVREHNAIVVVVALHGVAAVRPLLAAVGVGVGAGSSEFALETAGSSTPLLAR
jgi:hypothetical protein